MVTGILKTLQRKLKRNLPSNFMLVIYKKVGSLKETASGYTKMDAVINRYLSFNNKKFAKFDTKSLPMMDLGYFINNEVKKYFVKIKNWNILDVGCGSGIYSGFFKSNNFPYQKIKYQGCEVDSRIVEVCQKFYPNDSFFVSTAENIQSKDKNYNLVFSSGVLHYTLDGWKKAILEFKRVSSKYILISRFPVSKHNSTFYAKQNVISFNGVENNYFIVLNKQAFDNYLKSTGLKILKYDYTSEEYFIEGVTENIMLCTYLLQVS